MPVWGFLPQPASPITAPWPTHAVLGGGGVTRQIRTLVGNGTVTPGDDVVLWDASSQAPDGTELWTLTLPPAASMLGRPITIFRSDANGGAQVHVVTTSPDTMTVQGNIGATDEYLSQAQRLDLLAVLPGLWLGRWA